MATPPRNPDLPDYHICLGYGLQIQMTWRAGNLTEHLMGLPPHSFMVTERWFGTS